MTEQDRVAELVEDGVLGDLPLTQDQIPQPLEGEAPELEGATPLAREVGTANGLEVTELEGEGPGSEVTAPAGEAEIAPAGEAEIATDGASFTPVEEENPRLPRRLRDLSVGMELEGRVTSIALYGIFVDIGIGRDGLVHISEMSDTRINSPSDVVQINDLVKVRVKSLDFEARRISLTMRTVRERSPGESGGRRNRNRRAEVNREKLAELKVGDTVEGRVTGLSKFGAFVDIGVGKDGLVHISELAEGRVEKPEDAVQVGNVHTFKLLEIDPEGTRISLSLRKAQRIQKLQQLAPGQIFDGVVSGLAQFGAFVDIGVGRDGLVHISQLAEDHVEKVDDVVKEGDRIKVRVLEVETQSKRISLSMRLEEPPPKPQEPTASASTAVATPRTGPGAVARFTTAAALREEGQGRRDRGDRDGNRRSRRPRSQEVAVPHVPEFYATDDVEEEFTGNATLEDLMAKFGGPSRRDRRRQDEQREEVEVEEEDKQTLNQRQQKLKEAQHRTLRKADEDEGEG